MLNVHTIESLIQYHGYSVMTLIILLGNIGIPVPEETVVLVSGFLARKGTLDYRIVYPVCVLSATVGDSIGYWIGRTGGTRLILKYGNFLGLTPQKVSKFEEFFKKHGNKAVFLARFVAGLRFLGGPLSGTARMPFKTFLIYNLSGAVVWVFVMTQIGYHFGVAVVHAVEKWKWIMLAALVIAGAIQVRKWKPGR